MSLNYVVQYHMLSTLPFKEAHGLLQFYNPSRRLLHTTRVPITLLDWGNSEAEGWRTFVFASSAALLRLATFDLRRTRYTNYSNFTTTCKTLYTRATTRYWSLVIIL
jgi:hypothetical protein